MVLVAVLLPVARAAAGDQDAARPVHMPRYTVESGDSLWSIAQDFTQGGDPRPLIDAIEDRNGVSADSLQAGQTLLIPLP